jgi:iron(III) transport system substrate-binding protein
MRMAITSLLLLLAGTVDVAYGAKAGGEVNVYTFRQPDLLRPAFDLFTRRTGITVNVLYMDKGLIERIEAEGDNSPADVVIASDLARLEALKAAGVTQDPKDRGLASMPLSLRDADGQWFGLSKDIRAIYVSRTHIRVAKLGYEDLARPAWKGKVCMRDGHHISNLGLIAAMIAAHGADDTKAWLTKVKANLTGRPSGNDRTLIEAISEGKCDVAIGNLTTLAELRVQGTDEERGWASGIRLIYPRGDKGGFANLSGMALTLHAPNRDNAVKLMAFLTSSAGQERYVGQTLECPIVKGANPAAIIRAFGAPESATIPIAKILDGRDQAAALVDETGFNNGPGK